MTDKAQVKDEDKLTLVCKPAADLSTSSVMDKVLNKFINLTVCNFLQPDLFFSKVLKLL